MKSIQHLSERQKTKPATIAGLENKDVRNNKTKSSVHSITIQFENLKNFLFTFSFTFLKERNNNK